MYYYRHNTLQARFDEQKAMTQKVTVSILGIERGRQLNSFIRERFSILLYALKKITELLCE